MLAPSEIEGFRQRLLRLMRRVRGEETQVRDEVLQPGGGAAAGGISNVPLHLGDLGSHQFEEEIDLKLLQNEEFLLKEIGAALERIDQGTFGRCESCGQEIARERLQALPYGRLCIRCAEEQEK